MTDRRVLLPRAFKAQQAAEYLAMSVSKFRQLVDEGRIAPPREGDGLVTWDIKDLDAYYDGIPYRRPKVESWGEDVAA